MAAAPHVAEEEESMMHSVVTHALFMNPKLSCSDESQRRCVASQDIRFNELLVCEHVICCADRPSVRFLVERNETLFNSLYPREHAWSEEWSRPPPSSSSSSRRRTRTGSRDKTTDLKHTLTRMSGGPAAGDAPTEPQEVIPLKPNYLLADLAAKKVDLNIFTNGFVDAPTHRPPPHAVDDSCSVAPASASDATERGGGGGGAGAAAASNHNRGSGGTPMFLLGDKVSVFNHCCTPNTVARSFPLRIANGCVMTILAVFAVEGVKAGQELTLNYSAQHTGGGTREGKTVSRSELQQPQAPPQPNGRSNGSGAGGAGRGSGGRATAEDVKAMALAEGLLDCTCDKSLEDRIRKAAVIKRLAKAMHKREALSLIYAYLSNAQEDHGVLTQPHHQAGSGDGGGGAAQAPLIIGNVVLVEDKVSGGGDRDGRGGGGGGGPDQGGAPGMDGCANHNKDSTFEVFATIATRQYFGLKGLYDAGVGTDDDVIITQRALAYYNEKTAGAGFVKKHSEALSRFQGMLESFQTAALVEMQKTAQRSASRKERLPSNKKPRKECLVVQAPLSLR
jgi:hypothetical protein